MYNNVDENASLRCEDFTRCTCEWSTLFSKRGLIQWPSAHTASAQVEPSSIPSAFHHSANTKTAAWEVHQRITDKKKRKEKLAFPFFHPQNICRNRLDSGALLETELQHWKKKVICQDEMWEGSQRPTCLLTFSGCARLTLCLKLVTAVVMCGIAGLSTSTCCRFRLVGTGLGNH